ncbi:MAG: NAD-dependent epimerase/dehydratase family protein [Halioglobus sp.]
MKIIVTGANGFVGSALVEALLKTGDHDVVAVDKTTPSSPALEAARWVCGDIGEPEVISSLFEQSCDALVHLATLPGGAAEENRQLARQVNLDVTLDLLEAARSGSTVPRVVFASSIAVYGEFADAVIDDDTLPAPHMVYGAQKAMAEIWIATLTRRGEISGLSVRLPGIVARPQSHSGMKSAFMSDVFHAASNAKIFDAPVSPAATMWLMSQQCVVKNILHALTLDTNDLPHSFTVTLPGLRVAMGELVQAIAQHASCEQDFIRYTPDTDLEAVFGRQPDHQLRSAAMLGFSDDGDLHHLVASAFSTL